MNPFWIDFENMLPNPYRHNPDMDIEICEYPELCEFHLGRYEWGSTGVFVKEITQVEEMYDDKMYVGERDKKTELNPWSAPGHAYAPCNDGCGINGLNPGGCNNQAFENLEDYCPNGMCTTLYLIFNIFLSHDFSMAKRHKYYKYKLLIDIKLLAFYLHTLVDITKLLYGKCCPGGSECAQ